MAIHLTCESGQPLSIMPMCLLFRGFTVPLNPENALTHKSLFLYSLMLTAINKDHHHGAGPGAARPGVMPSSQGQSSVGGVRVHGAGHMGGGRVVRRRK